MYGGLTIAVAVLALTWTPASEAQDPLEPPGYSKYLVLPAPPTTRDAILVRHVYSGCNHSGPNFTRKFAIDTVARVVDYYMPEGTDEAGCAPADFVDKAYADSIVGYLPAGTYTLRFIYCGNPYDPGAFCEENPTLRDSFTVIEAGRPRHAIPTLSEAVKLALAAVLGLAGLTLLRTHGGVR